MRTKKSVISGIAFVFLVLTDSTWAQNSSSRNSVLAWYSTQFNSNSAKFEDYAGARNHTKHEIGDANGYDRDLVAHGSGVQFLVGDSQTFSFENYYSFPATSGATSTFDGALVTTVLFVDDDGDTDTNTSVSVDFHDQFTFSVVFQFNSAPTEDEIVFTLTESDFHDDVMVNYIAIGMKPSGEIFASYQDGGNSATISHYFTEIEDVGGPFGIPIQIVISYDSDTGEFTLANISSGYQTHKITLPANLLPRMRKLMLGYAPQSSRSCGCLIGDARLLDRVLSEDFVTRFTAIDGIKFGRSYYQDIQMPHVPTNGYKYDSNYPYNLMVLGYGDHQMVPIQKRVSRSLELGSVMVLSSSNNFTVANDFISRVDYQTGDHSFLFVSNDGATTTEFVNSNVPPGIASRTERIWRAQTRHRPFVGLGDDGGIYMQFPGLRNLGSTEAYVLLIDDNAGEGTANFVNADIDQYTTSGSSFDDVVLSYTFDQRRIHYFSIGLMNNDGAIIEFSNADISPVTEGETVSFYTLGYTNITSNSFNQSVDVYLSYSGGAESADFIELQKVTINLGSNSTSFSIGLIDDDIVELDETLVVQIASVSVGFFRPNTSRTVTILENDSAEVVFLNTSKTVAEGDTNASATFELQVEKAVAFNHGVTLSVTVANTFLEPSEYSIDSFYVEFAANSPAGATQSIDITINNDDIVEYNESLTLSILSTYFPKISFSTDDSVTLVVTDTDTTTITIDDMTVVGENDSLVFTVSLSNKVSAGASVTLMTKIGSALDVDDFIIASTKAFFSNDALTSSVAVQIVNDVIVELDETLEIYIQTVETVNTDIALSRFQITDVAYGTIEDNDTASLTVSAITSLESNNATITVTLSSEVIGGLVIELRSLANSAIADTDFTAFVDSYTFVGSSNEKVELLKVAITDDTIVENLESFEIYIGAITPSSLLSEGSIQRVTGTFSIADNDSATVSVSDNFEREDNNSVLISLVLDKLVTGGLTITLKTSTGSAESADFTAFSAKEIFFEGVENSNKTATVLISDDLLVEADETLLISISTVVTALLPVSSININDTATATIINDDSATISISNSTGFESGDQTITITLSKGVQGGITVTLADCIGCSGQNALSNIDFYSVSGSQTFIADGSTTGQIVAKFIDDSIVELDETVALLVQAIEPLEADPSSFTIPTQSSNIIIEPSLAGELRIVNDDTTSFTISSVSTAEAMDITLTITLDNAVVGGFTLTLATGLGSAIENTDYTSLDDATLYFDGNASEAQTLILAVTADQDIEIDETLQVSITTVTAAQVPTVNFVLTATDIATIINDDDITITLSDTSASEGDTIIFEASINRNVSGGFTATFSSSYVSAVSTDFTAISSFPVYFMGVADETQTIEVFSTADNLVEKDETLLLSITTVTDATVALSNFNIGDSAVAIIANDDSATISISNSTGFESSDQTITITLSNGVQGGITVTLADCIGCSGQNALSNVDFYTVTGSQTFIADGSTTGQIVVKFIDDTIVELDETVALVVQTIESLEADLSSFTIPTQSSNIIIEPSLAGQLQVVNDDTTSFTISSVSTAEAMDITLTITLDNAVVGGFTLTLATGLGSAIENTDYTSLDDATLYFDGNASEAQTLILAVTADQDIEIDETLQVSITTVTAAQVPTVNFVLTATDIATIINDDDITITLSDTSADEGDTIVFEASINRNVSGGFTATFSSSYVSAVSTDFTAISSFPVYFMGVANETQTIEVFSTVDNLVEKDETLLLSITTVTDATVALSNFNIGDSAVAIIANDDSATISISNSTGFESSDQTITITLSNGVQGGITVTLADCIGCSGQNALSNVDFYTVTGSQTFIADGSTTGQIVAKFIDDTIVELDETVALVVDSIEPLIEADQSSFHNTHPVV